MVSSTWRHCSGKELAALTNPRRAWALQFAMSVSALEGSLRLTLGERDDVDTQAACLEIARSFTLKELDLIRPSLGRVKHPALAPLVKHLEDLREHLRGKELEELNKGTPYERRTDRTRATAFVPRYGSSRIDVVYAFDTTYSESAQLAHRKDRLKREVRMLKETGADLRVGYVAYRDILRDRRESKRDYQVRVFPLTRDIDASDTWLDAVEAYGVPRPLRLPTAQKRRSQPKFLRLALGTWRRPARRPQICRCSARRVPLGVWPPCFS